MAHWKEMMRMSTSTEYAEVVISSLRLGDDQGGFSGSLFTNSKWFSFEEERAIHEQSTSIVDSPSPNTHVTTGDNGGDVVISNENDNKVLVGSATSELPRSKQDVDDAAIGKETDESIPSNSDKPTELIEWREAVEPESSESSVMTTEPAETSQPATGSLPNVDLEVIQL